MRTDTDELAGEAPLVERSFDGVRVGPLAPTPFAQWSSGAVTDPSSIYPRTFVPERDGVRSAKVFGPYIEDRCLCGKYEGERARGVCCEKCGVLVGSTRLRAERFGHIALPAPVPHPWLEAAIVAKSGMDRRTFDAVYEGSWAVVEGESASVSAWMDRGVELERDALWGPWALRERSDRPDGWIDVLPVFPPALRENVDDREDLQPDLDALCARAGLEGVEPRASTAPRRGTARRAASDGQAAHRRRARGAAAARVHRRRRADGPARVRSASVARGAQGSSKDRQPIVVALPCGARTSHANLAEPLGRGTSPTSRAS